ncbi:hypothetical protein [Mesonia sp.]|uniref:hypothetical protein n=1 Tax=Mesonia sp. TaxID=1960830 RepID=UPI0017607F58|nr:hypothetical protein [Mesonia sp.]HIB37676.1 hypothetical protein [Mesonia sp.]HIO26855.1 hypothetical protein [Flavobacteriaceae bacterium]
MAMKLTMYQLEEAAYIFEKANGYSHSAYEKKIISESQLKDINVAELEHIIVDGLNSRLYKIENERISAYWSLLKTGNHLLLVDNFVKWLEYELKYENKNTIFQILVALDAFGEPVFHKDRFGRDARDFELNIRDAKHYLSSFH